MFLCVGWQAQLWLSKAGIRGGCSLDFIKKAVSIGEAENVKPDKLDTATLSQTAPITCWNNCGLAVH